MKMKHSIFAGFAALALWACQASLVEPVPETPEQPEVPEVPEVPSFKLLTIEAGVPGQTKTSYKDDEYFSWSPSDQVSVLCNDGSNDEWITFTGQSVAFSSIFTSPLVPGTYEMGSTGGTKIALYPASEYHEYISDTEIRYHLPAVRDFRASSGGHEESAIPMFAFGTSDDVYSFANMTGAAKFTFENIPVAEVKFIFTSTGKKISGTFDLNNVGGGDASGVSWSTAAAGDATEKTLTFYADVNAAGEASFYVPYPAGSLPAGCRVQLMDVDGSFAFFDKVTASDIEIEKNRITVVSTQPTVAPSISVTESFAESTDEFVNPERGFYDHNDLAYYTTTSGPTALTYYSSENSLVFVKFLIQAFTNKDHISPNVLNCFSQVFNDVRAKGKKAIVRFVYTDTDTGDAQPYRVLNHIADVADVLTQNADVIYVVQAGFIGRWGEWQKDNSNCFSYIVSGSTVTDYDNYKAVSDALLAAVPESRQVALRTPYYKRFYLSPSSTGTWTPITSWDGKDANSRFSFHDDGFCGNQWHVGTWGDSSPNSADKLMWYSQSAYLAVGGETASSTSSWDPDPDYYSPLVTALTAVQKQHMSYLNGEPSNYIMEAWNVHGYAEDIRKALGYRLSLSKAEIGYSGLTAGSPLIVRLTLKNSGAASVINQRPMKLVLLRSDGSSIVLMENLGDVRTVGAGETKEFVKLCELPENIASGDRLALWLPDAYSSIQNRAAYAIRLVNDDGSEFEWVTFDGSDPTDPALRTGGYNAFYTF